MSRLTVLRDCELGESGWLMFKKFEDEIRRRVGSKE